MTDPISPDRDSPVIGKSVKPQYKTGCTGTYAGDGTERPGFPVTEVVTRRKYTSSSDRVICRRAIFFVTATSQSPGVTAFTCRL
nr:hypothetical protein [uncultured Mediterraneibacter sp.]